MKCINSILFALILASNLNAQVQYDTIPSDYYGSPHVYEHPVYFPDMGKQLSENIKCPENCNCNGRIIVSTIFGRDGKIKENKIIRSSGNITLDSIAYYATLKLHSWLPAMDNGRFFDEKFIYPIVFKCNDTIQSVLYPDSLNINPFPLKEIKRRKEYIDFYNSDENTLIDVDFYSFKGLTADYISKSVREIYYISKGYVSLRKKERYTFKIQSNVQDVKFILVENRTGKAGYKDVMANEIKIKKDMVYLIRNRTYTLIGYSEKDKKIAMHNIETDADKSIFMDFKTYTKKEYYNELERLVKGQIINL